MTIAQGLPSIVVAPLINVIFLAPILFTLFSSITPPATINVKFPKTMTSDVIADDDHVITITGENVIYWHNRIVAVKDLRGELNKLKNKGASVLIKTDRRASVGRIMDVWDLCRVLGVERINVATNQEQ